MERLNYLLLAGLFRLISLLPLRLARGLGMLIGNVLWWSRSVSRQVTEINLRICYPDMGKAQRRALARQSLQHLGMAIMETGLAWSAPADSVLALIRRVEGREHLLAARDQGKGVIVLAPHIGNWEVLGMYLADTVGITNMYQPPQNPALDRLISQGRTRNGAELVPTTTGGVKALLRVLKRGGVVGVLPDQVPPPNSGDFVPFFGIPALTPILSYNLIQRTGARAVMGYARRVAGGFELVFQPAPEAIYDADPQVSLAALNQGVEATVNDVPEQYQWEYKRFRKQPEGGPRYYRQPPKEQVTP